MNRPKIEDCTCEITSYELDGSETKQKVTDLKKYSFNLERYCDQLEKAYEDVKKGLDNACNKLEGLYLCIDVLTDKESKKDKEYWKKKVMKDD